MAVRANSGSTEFNADDLLEMQDRLAAMQVILSGCFDSSLIELRSLKNDVVIRQGTVDTVEKANKVHADAASKAEAMLAEATEKLRVAKNAQTDADSRLAEATKKETYLSNDMVARENKLQSDINGFADKEKAMRASVAAVEVSLKSEYDKKNKDLTAREIILKEGKEKLAADISEFQDKQTKFQAKVNAIMGDK